MTIAGAFANVPGVAFEKLLNGLTSLSLKFERHS